MSVISPVMPSEVDWSASDLEAAFAAPAFQPTLLTADSEVVIEADWAVVGAVAAILGLALGIVAYICSVCGARSFNACYYAVISYWGRGC